MTRQVKWIDVEVEDAIIDYVSYKIDAEHLNKKPKPYYRRGRGE